MRVWGRLVGGLCATILVVGCVDENEVANNDVCAPPGLIQSFENLNSDGQSSVRWSQIDNVETYKFVGADRGGSFSATNGDWLVESDKIRVVLQQPSRQHFVGNYGGTPIDADITRADGTWHDVLGELTSFIGLSYTVDAQRFEVIRDGRHGVLVVAAQGPLELLDFINLPGMAQLLGSNLVVGTADLQIQLPWDLNEIPDLNATYYYVFKSGATSFEMITAICNASDQDQWTTMTDFIDSGGTVSPFNNLSQINGEPGFGIELSIEGLSAPAGLVGYMGPSSGYGLRTDGEAMFFGYAGIGMIGHGFENLVQFLANAFIGINHADPPKGYFRLRPGESKTFRRDVFVFDQYQDMMDEVYRLDEVSNTARITGTLLHGDQPGYPGEIVAIAADGTLQTHARTDEDGVYSIKIPAGRYTIVGSAPGGFKGAEQDIEVAANKVYSVDLQSPFYGQLSFAVRGTDPSIGLQNAPLPAKVSLVCVDACPDNQTRLFTDTLYDSFADGLYLQAYVDHMDKVSLLNKRGGYQQDTLKVPPGDYQLVISRGPMYSRYVQDISLGANELLHIDAWLSKVVDTSGYVSADLHVHTVNSPDSPIPLIDRVLSFAAEAVDVLVTTDHDFLTDLEPVIEQMEMTPYLTSLVGEELTFVDAGHFNAYPLALDPDDRQGGALDGAGGRGPTLSPEQFMTAFDERGSVPRPVVQVNHGRSLLFGYFAAIGLDSGDLTTQTPMEVFRVDPASVTTTVGDTGLFSDRFDAFEVYNDYHEINAGLNDLFSFLNLGLQKTGVAVSDTHNWYGSEAGAPRSMVYLGQGTGPEDFTPELFTRAIQDGRLMGTNGPMLEVQVQRGDQLAVMGDTLSGSGTFDVQIVVRMPDWYHIDTIDIFSNTPNTHSQNGDAVHHYPAPERRHRIQASEVTTGGGLHTVSWSTTMQADRDRWLVITAHDDPDFGDNWSMFPVLTSTEEHPFAFSNAIYIDADGNGQFDAPGVQGQPQNGSGQIPSFAPSGQWNQRSIGSLIEWAFHAKAH